MPEYPSILGDKFSLSNLDIPQKNPLICTLVGDGGMGKTTLGSLFPAPVFIRTEDGTKAIETRQDVALFPLCETSDDVLECLRVLLTENHKFRTVVLDTITQMNVMIEAEICQLDSQSNGGKFRAINQALGGYGAGYKAASERHRAIRDACGILSLKKQMNIVFLAHADVETVTLPDQDPFMRYSIRMNSKSVSHYTDNVDMVAMLKLEMFTTGKGDTKKATGSGTRIITCYPHPAHVSKNRLGIKNDLPWDGVTNPFIPYL